tara:strand:+ start:48401 stop:49066 length:666 start_codon:yes stop_codon:yes gene_type:complete
MDRWYELINYLDMIAAWAQVIITFIALCAGLNYLNQHRNKIKIEREHRFAEKMIELIYAIDSQMEELFKDKILDSPEWKEEAKRIDEITEGFTLLGYPEMRYYYRRHLVVKANKEIVYGKIIALNKELALYIGYFDDHRLNFNRQRMFFTAKALIDWTVETFPRLMQEEKGSTNEFIKYFFETIVPKFPDTMYVQSPQVKSYEIYRDKLTELIFNIFKDKN